MSWTRQEHGMQNFNLILLLEWQEEVWRTAYGPVGSSVERRNRRWGEIRWCFPVHLPVQSKIKWKLKKNKITFPSQLQGHFPNWGHIVVGEWVCGHSLKHKQWTYHWKKIWLSLHQPKIANSSSVSMGFLNPLMNLLTFLTSSQGSECLSKRPLANWEFSFTYWRKANKVS